VSKRRLGKGIDALLQGRPLDQLSEMSSIHMVDVDSIVPNPGQPRRQFNEETLNELAASIREKGVIQPIIAEDRGNGAFMIVAGERRYRAAKLAGLTEVPVILQDLTEEEMLEIALIENIQREDLNAIDEARALQSAMEQSGATQEQLARRLGKSRSAIANSLRLLRLAPDIQEALTDGSITAGHARALLSLEDEEARRGLFDRVRDEDLSVRDAELAAKQLCMPPASGATVTHEPPPAGERQKRAQPPDGRSVELRRIQDRLIDVLGTQVVVKGTNVRGRIEISYFSTSDLERVIEAMGISLE
jgi:ParB family transcriptional regulator, chromosome partitioning protein